MTIDLFSNLRVRKGSLLPPQDWQSRSYKKLSKIAEKISKAMKKLGWRTYHNRASET